MGLLFLLEILLIVCLPIIVIVGMIPIIIKSFKLLRIRIHKVDQEIENYEKDRREQKRRQDYPPAEKPPIKRERKEPTFEEWKASREAEKEQ